MKSAHKYLVLASLYVVQSVPLSFFKNGFQLFLKDQQIDYSSISRVIGILLLPWVIKFLWAPLVDRWTNGQLPKIKYAILLFQIIGAALLGFLALFSVPQSLQAIVAVFFVFSLISATQDIFIDSMAVLTLPKNEHSLGNTFQIGGYYLGEILGGALILVIFDHFGWNWAMLAFMLFYLLPFIPLLFYKTPQEQQPPPQPKKEKGPIINYLKLPGMGIWLLVMMVYMGNQILSRTLLPSLFADIGYSKTDIASIISIWGNSASVLAAIIGGVLINKWGRKNSLVGFGILKVLTLLGFFLIKGGVAHNTVIAVVMINDFVSGLATVTLYTIMMDKARLSSPGTDFTIQQSVNQFAVLFFVFISGQLVGMQGGNFGLLFSIACFVGIAGVLLAVFGLSRKSLDNDTSNIL